MNVVEITKDLQAELTNIAADPLITPSSLSKCTELTEGMSKLLRDALSEPLPRVEHLAAYISQLLGNLAAVESDIEIMGGYVLMVGRADDLFRLKLALLCRDALVFKIQMLTDVQETLRQIETEMRGAQMEFVN